MGMRRRAVVVIAIVALWVTASEAIGLVTLLVHWPEDAALRGFWAWRDSIDMVEGIAAESATAAAIFGMLAIVNERRQQLATISPRRIGYWGAIAGILALAIASIPSRAGASSVPDGWRDLAPAFLLAGGAGLWSARATLWLGRWLASRAYATRPAQYLPATERAHEQVSSRNFAVVSPGSKTPAVRSWRRR